MKVQTPVLGGVCYSLQGRDKGKLYVITGILPNGWVQVCDGKQKTLQAPKKKNGKHLHYLADRNEAIYTALTHKSAIQNCDIAHYLKQFAQTLSTKSANADGK